MDLSLARPASVPPPASPASIAFAATFFAARCLLKRRQVTLLRSGLEATKSLLDVGILTSGFEQLFIQRGVIALRFHRILACLLQ